MSNTISEKKDENIKQNKARPERDLTVGSPFKLIVAFAVPMILGNLLQQLYNFVDTMIVGHFLGVQALAGVGATGSINFLIVGFCIGICSGFAIPVAQRFGAKDYVSLRKYVANATYLSVVFSALMTVVVSTLCRQILLWMRTPEDIIDYSYVYILTIFFGIPVTFLYNLLAGIIRAIGDSKTPLYFLMISTVVNLFLDYTFIAQLGLGIFGAAFATVLSQLVSGILCLIVIVKRFTVLHVSGDEWKIDVEYMKMLCKMGLPMGLQYSITAIGSVILQSSVNMLGSIAVAAITAANKINMLFMCILDALGGTMATYGGQNLGAGRIDRIRKGTMTAVLIGFAYSVIAFVAAYFVRVPLIMLFVDRPIPEMVDMAALQIIITMGSMCTLVLVNVLRFLIQGVGFSGLAVLAGVSEMIARTIAGLVIIPAFGFLGACVAGPLAWIFADMFLIPAYIYVMKKLEIRINKAHTEFDSPY